MPDSVKNILGKLKTYWTDLPKGKKTGLVTMTLLLISVATVLIVLFSRTEYVVLYSDLEYHEAGEIYSKLTEMGVDVKLKNDNTILVKEGKSDALKMQLASEGYPRSGLAYDTYIDNVSLGISESEKQVYKLFQLQDRLQNTIKTLNGIQSAIVTISRPDDNLFVLQSQKTPLTAAVVIDIKPGHSLSAANVKAIEHLVAKSLSGLSTENISIIDTQMNVLNRKSDSDIGGASERYELQKALEDELQNKIVSMMEPIYGYGNIRVAASVSLDFDKVSEERTEFTPVLDDNGIAYSHTEKKETVNEVSKAVLGTADDTLLGSDASSSEVNTQYYVNQSVKFLEHDKGKISDMRLSIVINNADIADDTIAALRTMAAYATGADEGKITVQGMEFTTPSSDITGPDAQEVIDNPFIQQILVPDFILKAVMVLVMLVLGVILMSTIRKVINAEQKKEAAHRAKAEELVLQELGTQVDPEESYREEIDKYVDKNPEGVADILKKWMSEDK